MVWRIYFFSAILTISVILHLTSAQLSTNEALHNKTACDLKSDIQLDCGPGSKIAVNSFRYSYNVNCETTCCTFDKSHCFVEAGINDIQAVTRNCSGKSSCPVHITTEKAEFTTCFLGVQDISYVYLEYYCLPSNNTLSKIDCDEHYSNNKIESKLLDSHYVKIDFINNSTSNQQGLFFVGLDASDTGKRYKLTCSSQPETWCAGCGNLPSIDNGNITLSKENDFSYEATAEVTCDSGFKTDTPNISCQTNGSWSIAKCTEKPPCSANEWRCANGDCILESEKCDNVPNCIDESDERSCSDPSCPESLELCKHSNGSHVCVDKGTECGTTPAIRPKKKKDTGVDIIIIIVVVVLCLIILLQLLVMCYLQCKIHNKRTTAKPDKSEVSKRIVMTILGSIPAVGLIPIYKTWKILKTQTQVSNGRGKSEGQ